MDSKATVQRALRESSCPKVRRQPELFHRSLVDGAANKDFHRTDHPDFDARIGFNDSDVIEDILHWRCTNASRESGSACCIKDQTGQRISMKGQSSCSLSSRLRWGTPRRRLLIHSPASATAVPDKILTKVANPTSTTQDARTLGP